MTDTPAAFGDPLTQREMGVRELLLEGLTSKEIAIRLGISPRTVEVHRYRVLVKSGARNAVHLARLVFGVNRKDVNA
jgi:DNA-binding NarL/FixJ family response regulator